MYIIGESERPCFTPQCSSPNQPSLKISKQSPQWFNTQQFNTQSILTCLLLVSAESGLLGQKESSKTNSSDNHEDCLTIDLSHTVSHTVSVLSILLGISHCSLHTIRLNSSSTLVPLSQTTLLVLDCLVSILVCVC